MIFDSNPQYSFLACSFLQHSAQVLYEYCFYWKKANEWEWQSELMTVKFQIYFIVICFSHPCNHFGKENIFFSSKKPINVFVSSPFVFNWVWDGGERAQNDLTSIYVMETQCAILFAANPSSHCLWRCCSLCCVMVRCGEAENSMSFIVCVCVSVTPLPCTEMSCSFQKLWWSFDFAISAASSSSSWCEDGNVLIVKVYAHFLWFNCVVFFSYFYPQD